MAFTVSECTTKDFTDTRLIDPIFDAFAGNSTFHNILHPHNMTSTGRETARKFLYKQSLHPSQRWIKILDESSSMIVGVAQYALYTGLKGEKMPVAPLDAPEGNWSDPEDEELAQTMYLSFIEIQNAVVPDGAKAILCLLKFCISPEYQKRGGGKLLLEWGIGLADEACAEMVVVSSVAGKPVYEKFGFADWGPVKFKVTERFGDTPAPNLSVLRRAPRRKK